MPIPRRNIEAKYRCADLAAVRFRAEALGARDAGILHQIDHFFEAARGRLKLRDCGDGRAELIGYVRSDAAEARGSDYHLYPTADAPRLLEVLRHVLGAAGVVRKTRHLLLLRSTRIHLDRVEGLGAFVELETVLDGQSDSEAEHELAEIQSALGLHTHAILAEAYVDLLAGDFQGVPT